MIGSAEEAKVFWSFFSKKDCFLPSPAIAVSGGPDSLCLALLARNCGDPLALIVDHGLRENSAEEAAVTAMRLDRAGIASRILTLTDVPADAAGARTARFAALIAATREAGRIDLWLGHHLRDQAETALIRRGAGSAAAGLAGMAFVRETRHVRILRPLLETPPGALRDTLRRGGVDWVEDPSNRNLAGLRARLRDGLDDATGHGPRVLGLAHDALEAGRARAARDHAMAGELAEHVAIFPEGFAHLRPGAIAADALGALIRTLGGAAYAPRGRSVARLAAAPVPAVLGGVRLVPAGRFGPGLLLVREAAALAADMPARRGAVWDGRFVIDVLDAPAGATIGAVGADASRLRRHTPLPEVVLRALPCLRVHGALAEVPHIGYRLEDGSARMAVSFAPANPVCGAPFGVGPARGCTSEAASPFA